MKIKRLIVISCMGWFLCFAFGQSQPPAPSAGQPNQDQQHKAPAEQQKADSKNEPSGTVLTSVNQSAPKPKSGNQQQTTYERIKKATYRWGSVASDILIAIFTAALVGVAIVQAVIYGKQARLMRLSIDQAKEAAERGQRAFIGISLREGASLSVNPYTFTVWLRNGGQTPAYQVKTFMRWKSFEGHKTAWTKGVPYVHDEVEEYSVLTIGPGHEASMRSLLAVTDGTGPFADRFTRFWSHSDASIYLYGRVEYFDIFKQPHFTHYCYLLIREGARCSLSTCDHHNDSD